MHSACPNANHSSQDGSFPPGLVPFFPFIRLPAELRDEIYHYVLGQGAIGSYTYMQPVRDPRTLHPIFRLCRQIRLEALEIYFKTTTLRVSLPHPPDDNIAEDEDAFWLLKGLGEFGRSRLRNVTIMWGTDSTYLKSESALDITMQQGLSVQALADLPSLRVLRLHLYMKGIRVFPTGQRRTDVDYSQYYLHELRRACAKYERAGLFELQKRDNLRLVLDLRLCISIPQPYNEDLMLALHMVATTLVDRMPSGIEIELLGQRVVGDI